MSFIFHFIINDNINMLQSCHLMQQGYKSWHLSFEVTIFTSFRDKIFFILYAKQIVSSIFQIQSETILKQNPTRKIHFFFWSTLQTRNTNSSQYQHIIFSKQHKIFNFNQRIWSAVGSVYETKILTMMYEFPFAVEKVLSISNIVFSTFPIISQLKSF